MKKVCAILILLMLTGCSAQNSDSSDAVVIYAERETETQAATETDTDAETNAPSETTPPTEPAPTEPVPSPEETSPQIGDTVPVDTSTEPVTIVGTWKWTDEHSDESHIIFQEDGSLLMREDFSDTVHLDADTFWYDGESYAVSMDDAAIIVTDGSDTILHLTAQEGSARDLSGRYTLGDCELSKDFDFGDQVFVYLQNGMFFFEMPGTYTMEGTTLTIQAGEEKISEEYAIKGNILILTSNQNGNYETEYMCRVQG